MKKNKMKDTTTFIIALSICLGIICTSIVFASVFSRQEDSAKAEVVDENGFSFATYGHGFDALLDQIYIASNDPSSTYWQNTFLYLTNNGDPYVVPSSPNSYKTNFTIDVDFYNPNHCNISEVVLGDTATDWGNRFVSHDILSTDALIRGHYSFAPFTEALGSVSFGNFTQSTYYITYIQLSFTYNYIPYSFTFGSPYFYDNMLNQHTLGYNSGYNEGFTAGVDSIASTIVPPLPSYSLQGLNFSSSPFTFETASSDIDVYSSTNGDFQNVAFGFMLNASPDTFYADTDYKIEFSVSVPDLSPVANSLSSCFLFGSANVYTTYDNITFSSSSSGNYTYYSGFVFSVTDAQYGLGIRFNFDNLDLPIARNYLMSINNIRITAIDSSVNAYEEGYDAGFTNGQTSGYNEGYTDGLAMNDHTFLGLMGAVVDAPIQAVMNMFDFDILGMNMRGFYLSLFTLCLVITIVKFVLVK